MTKVVRVPRKYTFYMTRNCLERYAPQEGNETALALDHRCENAFGTAQP